MGHHDIWRQRLWVWLPAAVFVIANLVVLGVYRFAYSDRVHVLQQELKAQEETRHHALADRRRIEGLLRLTQVNRQRVAQLYDQYFSTRQRRMTAVTAEVESLATKAGLAPRAFSYPEEEIQGYGLIKRSFIFSVQGTYQGLRRFINLLELSDSFMTLESVALAEGSTGARGLPGQELRVDLRISTLFAKDGDGALATPAASTRARQASSGGRH